MIFLWNCTAIKWCGQNLFELNWGEGTSSKSAVTFKKGPRRGLSKTDFRWQKWEGGLKISKWWWRHLWPPHYNNKMSSFWLKISNYMHLKSISILKDLLFHSFYLGPKKWKHVIVKYYHCLKSISLGRYEIVWTHCEGWWHSFKLSTYLMSKMGLNFTEIHLFGRKTISEFDRCS